MKKLFWAVLVSMLLVFGASAQSGDNAEFFSQIKKDYQKVRAVALVKIKNVESVEDRGYITYAADGEIVESFKGEFTRGQPIKYYFIAEAGYDIKLYPKESIIFLEGKYPVKSVVKTKGWFQLENSNLPPSAENISMMRRIKSGRNRGGMKRRTHLNKADKAARAGFYFQLSMRDADSYAGWEDEALQLFRASGISAFFGVGLRYKGIKFESFIPVRSLRAVENPRDFKSVWVGAFETEEAATSALEKFSVVLHPILRKTKQEQAELQYNAKFENFDTWSIGAIEISGSEVEKPNSPSDEAAATRDWNEFWTKFRAAVQQRDRAALRSLTSFSIRLDNRIVPANAAFERFGSDAGEGIWKKLDKSLATGAKVDDDLSSRRPHRLTGDGTLIFRFDNNGKWRWSGFFKD